MKYYVIVRFVRVHYNPRVLVQTGERPYSADELKMLIGDDEMVIHPTHGQYPQARKHLPPQNLKPLVSLPVTIPLVGGDRPINLLKADTPLDTDTNPTQWLDYLYSLDIQPIDTQTQGHNQALIHCPECGSTDTKGNGYYKGKPRRRCKSCGKSWVT